MVLELWVNHMIHCLMVKRHRWCICYMFQILTAYLKVFSDCIITSTSDCYWYETMEPMEFTSENETGFEPRAYQIDLYEKAVENNTIIYLPTGAGKTYIAVMLLKHLSSDVRKYVIFLHGNVSLSMMWSDWWHFFNCHRISIDIMYLLDSKDLFSFYI